MTKEEAKRIYYSLDEQEKQLLNGIVKFNCVIYCVVSTIFLLLTLALIILAFVGIDEEIVFLVPAIFPLLFFLFLFYFFIRCTTKNKYINVIKSYGSENFFRGVLQRKKQEKIDSRKNDFLSNTYYNSEEELKRKAKKTNIELSNISYYVNLFENDDKIVTILKNYCSKNTIYNEVIEYYFFPNIFDLEKKEIEKESSFKNFILGISQEDLDDLQQELESKNYDRTYIGCFYLLNRLENRYKQEGCDFLIRIYSLYKLLKNQGVIEEDDQYEKEQFHALAFLLYRYSKLFFNDYLKEDLETLNYKINDSVPRIIKKYYEANYSEETIVTRIWSINSYNKNFCDLFLVDYDKIEKEVKEIIQDLKEKKKLEELLSGNNHNESISNKDIDSMDGVEFENFIAKLFSILGYKTMLTKGSGDQGIDVIAEKTDCRIAIQAKHYSGSVGNHAIMEAYAGAKYYNANKCMVITNSYFTDKAKELAISNSVELWDGIRLKMEIAKL